jgi:hypothetical protein
VFSLYNQRAQRPRLLSFSGPLFPWPAPRLRFCTAVVLLLLVTCYLSYNQRAQWPRLLSLSGPLFPLAALRLRFCTAVVLLLLVSFYIISGPNGRVCSFLVATCFRCRRCGCVFVRLLFCCYLLLVTWRVVSSRPSVGG